MDKIQKDSDNPFFKSRYASLTAILENIQLPLSDAGLCFSQVPDGLNGLTSILIHAESGEYISGTYNISPEKNSPQAIGSAITYARRYALGAILGLNIDEDDDGNASIHPSKQSNNQVTDNKQWLNENTDNWKRVLAHLKGGGKMDDIKVKYKISKPNEEKLKQQALQ